MSNIGILKTDVARVAAMMESGEYADANELAQAVLEESYASYEKATKFMVMAVLVAEDDEELTGESVCFGPYKSFATARDAASSVGLGNAAEERWIVPVNHGTPAAWLSTKRSEAKQQAVDTRAARPWLIEFSQQSAIKADIARKRKGLLSLEELKVKYPSSGWEPAEEES